VTLAGADGLPSYTWTLASGSGPLPPWATLSATGTISGTPTATGTWNPTFQLKDQNNLTATKQLSLSVYTLPAITTLSPLPDA